MFEPVVLMTHTKRNILFSIGVVFIVGLLFAVVGYYAYIPTLNTPPSDFPLASDITIVEGSTQSEIAEYLKEQRVIRSSFYFYIYLRQHYADSFIKAGTYRFNAAQTTAEVTDALVHGTDQSPLVKITFPEGFTIKNMETIVGRPIPHEKLAQALQYEGYLFPDTYFISNETELDEIISIMRTTFDEKIAPYKERISNSNFTQEELVILASIVEREAKDEQSMKMVSAILQNRLAINMPLQVDAVFDYVLNKTSDELTIDDLAIDSPFNTYIHTGLPPAPISNPGLVAIEAVLTPGKTTNLYYLTADDGTFYYAKTFEEHKRNKERYLQ